MIQMSETNMDCWEGCYDEKTQWAMKMQSKIIDGVEHNYCPKCNRVWPLDWDQYRRCPHEVKQRSLTHYFKHKEQNPEPFEEDSTEVTVNCTHCYGIGTTMKEFRPTPNYTSGIDIEVECDHCGGSGKTTMLGPKHCQHKEREIGDPMKLTGEGCSNEPQYKCEAQNWCNGDWVCGEHWVKHDWHDWSCVICSQEYAVYGN